MRRRDTKIGPWALLVSTLAVLLVSGMAEAQERGYLGINVECKCSRLQEGDAVVWQFMSLPVVTAIRKGGPGERSGLRKGDVILAIDGIDITSEAGGRMFGNMPQGEPRRFRVRRGEGETTLTITPGTASEAFGEEFAVLWQPMKYDSIKVQLEQLYAGQIKLQNALQEAEAALARTEAEARRAVSQEQLRWAEQQRLEIDSMRRQLLKSHQQIRLHADSLAARTLYVKPSVEIRTRAAPNVEARTLTVYSDAVAGARFEELTRESPWLSYLPGVEEGLLIVKVVENTPAHSAGLREGDVIVAVNGESVRTVAELRKRLCRSCQAELSYIREGKKRTCKIPSK